MSGLTPVSFKKQRAHEPRLSAPYVRGRRAERFWSDAEDAILRERYPTVGMKGCVPFLPNRTSTSIYQRAKKLGFEAPVSTGERRRHDYGPEMDARIRAAWPELKGRGAVAALADRLGVPRAWLTGRATKLALTMPHRKEPPWTEAEVALLRHLPLHDPERCAILFREHGFHRSPTSITVKCARLRISRRTHETLSARAAAAILGIDDKSVTAECIAGRLRAGRRGSDRLTQQGGDAWAIEPADLRRYVLDHIERIDIRKVDRVAFVALIAGPDAIDPQAAGPCGGSEALREANRTLCERVAELQADNARLAARADRSAAEPVRPRLSWRDRAYGRDRRRA